MSLKRLLEEDFGESWCVDEAIISNSLRLPLHMRPYIFNLFSFPYAATPRNS